MKKILLVIDAQNDFINGALGSPEAQEAAKKIVHLVADERWDRVIATVDHHLPKQARRMIEAKTIPPHCTAHSPGAALYEGIAEHVDHIIRKNTFSMDDCYAELRPYLSTRVHDGDDTEFFICGLCTDVCVVSNALGLRSAFPCNKITVLADACAGTSPERHKAALAVMDSCLVDVLDTNEVN